MTNCPLWKRNPGSRVVRKENRLSVQCWTQVTVSTRKALEAFGAGWATITSVIELSAFLKPADLDVAADVGDRAGRARDVDAALGLVGPFPTSRAQLLAVFHRRRAGPAADRGEALLDERVRRQVVFGHVG